MPHTQNHTPPAAPGKPLPDTLFIHPSSCAIKIKRPGELYRSNKIFGCSHPFADYQPGQTKTICAKLLLFMFGLVAFVLFQTVSFLPWAQSAAASSFGVESIPNPRLQSNSQYVSNPDGIITAADEAEINRLASALERDLGVQVAVAALGDIGDKEYRMFATELFNYWGVGQKDEDNGLLILLVLDPAQRSITFETGYGLEGVMPDAICYRIQQNYMIPALKNGNYSQGMRDGMAAVDRYLRDSGYQSGAAQLPENTYYESSEHDYTEDIVVTLVMTVLPICFMLFMIWRHVRPRICPSCGQRGYKRYEVQIISQPSFHHPGLAIDTWSC
ncbi:MAG: TPM domain-containing protein, partial [Desulfovibrionaceae bacterium]|nr:TPM domain-containing protein [Desulfovibrionaceae bacterium]